METLRRYGNVVYRRLIEGEMIQDGDMLGDPGGTEQDFWPVTLTVGYVYGLGHVTTWRPVREQSPGWRYLDEGEEIKDGDEARGLDGFVPVIWRGRVHKSVVGAQRRRYQVEGEEIQNVDSSDESVDVLEHVRCGCGHHDIEFGADPYEQHARWEMKAGVSGKRKDQKVRHVQGVGVSKPEREVGFAEFWGEEFER